MIYFLAAHILSATLVIASIWGYLKCTQRSPSR